MNNTIRRVLVAALCTAVAASVGHRVAAQSPACPCSIWTPATVPANAALTDGQPIEIGVKFRSDVAGFITAVRFYKGSANTGVHVGHLWSAGGALLAEATFTNESASGWQEITLSPAVAISANATYIASYHADSGYFAFDGSFFAAAGVDSPPLHAFGSGVDGPNGVFRYGVSGFPTGGASNNYWVDVVFHTDLGPDTTPPTVISVSPANGATAAPLASTIKAIFSEAIEPASISASTFEVRDADGNLLSSTVSYDAGSRTATLASTAGLLPVTTYTATVRGGVAGVVDRAGNALASDVVWSFTTSTPTPPPNDGPGGPILVISSSSNPFGRYYAEILRAEGLNEFTATDISLVTPSTLDNYDVVILGELPLTSSQAGMLTDWVSNGGNLVAMRPDKRLAGPLGLTDQSATLANAYLQVNTASAPGAGIVSDTIQFHGAADRYVTNGASTIATLFSDATTATPSPAVTIAAVGTHGGQAAAFTFDLARSIVYTRQGNPAWSGQERDGISPIRSDDLFFGAAGGDIQPDWIDLNKVAIPQADEQQRLLANLVLHLNRARKPFPRFWYLPRGAKAALVMTGDDHGNGGTVGRFNQYKSLSAPGCSVADWQCVRSTSYIYNGTPGMDDAASFGFVTDGFEVGLHVTSDCANWTLSSLASFYSTQIALFHAQRPSVPAIQTNRTHCIVWSDYVTQPKVELANGIRFDTNYYFFPPNWVQNRPGLFTGSAMPMRFADFDGSTIDVYQAATQMTDESEQTYPFTSDTLFDRALGPLGYYGVFTANMHTDLPTEQPSDASVGSAIARGVPVVSARQMLEWLDGRNGSSFGSIAFNAGTLTFTISAAAGSNGLTAMLPTEARGEPLVGITRDGAAVAYDVQIIKGVEYAFFTGFAGAYAAAYTVPDTTPPVISGVTVTPELGNAALVSWSTNEPADARVDYGTSPSALTNQATSGGFTTSHALGLNGLTALTTYYYRVTSADAAGNSASSAIGSFKMPVTEFTATDTTVADFSAGTLDGHEYIAATADGEVILSPAAGSEFLGTSVPAGWSATAWGTGGGATVAGGVAVVDGARLGTIATYPAGRSLEFVATFSGAPFQHVGFGITFNETPWAIFSTFGGGALYARTNSASGSIDTLLNGTLIGSSHRFRIDWAPGSIVYSVDGAIVATHSIAITGSLRPLISDLTPGSGAVSVDWARMSPYAAAGTFLSRVVDAGQSVTWRGLSWVVNTPSGTSATFFARHGDTPLPDATWSPLAPIAQSGGAIGGSSRYAQYRVDLSSTSPGVTPAVNQVTVGYAGVFANRPPLANGDSYNGTQNTVLTLGAPGVLANDSDADSDPIAAALVTGASHGVVALQANGSFTYTPSAGYSGADSFAYKANDGQADSGVATVTLSIAAAAHQPIGAADSYSTSEDTTVFIAAPGVLTNDSDPDGRALTAVLVRGPLHGELTSFSANGSFRYKPALNFNGADNFVYHVVAGGVQSIDTTVSIAVAAVNDAPTANDDIYVNNQFSTLNVAAPGVLANDTDVDGDALTAVLVAKPVHGKLTLQADGSFTYTSNASFDGADSFTYKASDGPKKSSTTTVYITGDTANPGFVARPDSYTTSAGTTLVVAAPGVLVNDTDTGGEALTALLVTPPPHGTLTLNGDGSFTYIPAAGFTGVDTFIYRVMCEDGDFTTPTLASIAVQ